MHWGTNILEIKLLAAACEDLLVAFNMRWWSKYRRSMLFTKFNRTVNLADNGSSGTLICEVSEYLSCVLVTIGQHQGVLLPVMTFYIHVTAEPSRYTNL